MVRHGCATPIAMAVLHVRATLADKLEAKRVEDPTYLPWFKDGSFRHVLCRDRNALRTDELRFESGFSILQEHFDDLTQVLLQFIESLTLRMCSWESGDVADIIASVGAAFDDRSVNPHA